MSRRNRRLRADDHPAHKAVTRAQGVMLWLMRAGFIAVGCTGLALLVASSWRAFVAIDALRLTTVHVRGGHRSNKEALLVAAGTNYGDPLMSIDLGQVANDMVGHPWVRTATVRRQLPNRLHIDVQEHTPKALTMLGSLWLVNTLGEPFKPFVSDDGFSLPIITGLVPQSAAAAASAPALSIPSGTPPWGPQPLPSMAVHPGRMQEALGLLDALHDQYGDTLTVQQVHYDEDLGFSVYLLAANQAQPSSAPEHGPTVVHLGHTPNTRIEAIGQTLAVLQQAHMGAAIIWANGVRAPNRVQVQPFAQVQSTHAKGAEKSQSVSNRRTIPPRTLPNG